MTRSGARRPPDREDLRNGTHRAWLHATEPRTWPDGRTDVSAALVTDYDAIVIGAGHNGLVCAAYLARAGLQTLLLEARSSVGGCASTVDALGARVNICNCDHVTFRTTPVMDELRLADHGLRYLD